MASCDDEDEETGNRVDMGQENNHSQEETAEDVSQENDQQNDAPTNFDERDFEDDGNNQTRADDAYNQTREEDSDHQTRAEDGESGFEDDQSEIAEDSRVDEAARPIESSSQDLQKRLFDLRMKMNQARALNKKQIQQEEARLTETSAQRKKRLEREYRKRQQEEREQHPPTVYVLSICYSCSKTWNSERRKGCSAAS